ncbi:MAG: hypothetical protein ABGY11_09695 [Candidatus Thioglobus sp.]
MLFSQSESTENILVMLDVDGVLLDRCNKALLTEALQTVLLRYLSTLEADAPCGFDEASFRAIFLKLFSENNMWHKVFYLDRGCSKGEVDIATQFLIVLRDRLFPSLGEAAEALASGPDSLESFIMRFLNQQLGDIMLDHRSGWSFVTTPLIRKQLQDALEKYSVCFVTNGVHNTWEHINELFDGIIPPEYYYVVDPDEHPNHVQFCQQYYRIDCAGRDHYWKPPRILLAKDKLGSLYSRCSVDSLLVVDDQPENGQDCKILSEVFPYGVAGVESMSLLEAGAQTMTAERRESRAALQPAIVRVLDPIYPVLPDLSKYPLWGGKALGATAGIFYSSLPGEDARANAFSLKVDATKPPSPTSVSMLAC